MFNLYKYIYYNFCVFKEDEDYEIIKFNDTYTYSEKINRN